MINAIDFPLWLEMTLVQGFLKEFPHDCHFFSGEIQQA